MQPECLVVTESSTDRHGFWEAHVLCECGSELKGNGDTIKRSLWQRNRAAFYAKHGQPVVTSE